MLTAYHVANLITQQNRDSLRAINVWLPDRNLGAAQLANRHWNYFLLTSPDLRNLASIIIPAVRMTQLELAFRLQEWLRNEADNSEKIEWQYVKKAEDFTARWGRFRVEAVAVEIDRYAGLRFYSLPNDYRALRTLAEKYSNAYAALIIRRLRLGYYSLSSRLPRELVEITLAKCLETELKQLAGMELEQRDRIASNAN